jgi:hypothetical protein
MTLEQRVQHLELELRKARPSASSDAPALMKRISALESEIARLKSSTPRKPAVYTPAPAPVVAKPADSTLAIKVTALEREIERLKVKESAGAWMDWTPSITWEGGTTDPTTTTVTHARYTKIGKLVTFSILFNITRGTGDRNLCRFTLPTSAKTTGQTLTAYQTLTVGGYGASAASRVVASTSTAFVFTGTMTADGSIWCAGSYEAT